MYFKIRDYIRENANYTEKTAVHHKTVKDNNIGKNWKIKSVQNKIYVNRKKWVPQQKLQYKPKKRPRLRKTFKKIEWIYEVETGWTACHELR